MAEAPTTPAATDGPAPLYAEVPAVVDAPAIEAVVEVPAVEAAPEPALEPVVEEPTPDAPVEYSFKLPENFEVDESALTEFKSYATEAKLTQEQGQKLLDLFVTQQTKAASAAETSFKSTNEAWRKEIMSDPLLGGDRHEAAFQTIAKALDQYGGKEAREAFDLTGAGNNPAIIRMIHKMATALSEGTFVQGNVPTRPKSGADILYPSTQQ